MREIFWIPSLIIATAFVTSSCNLLPSVPKDLQLPQTHTIYLEDMRLGDGVPLNLHATLRWSISNPKAFARQHLSAADYHKNSLIPRSKEALSLLSNDFASVDSVFGNQRDYFLHRVKDVLRGVLDTDLVQVEEVLVTEIVFPLAYTEAKEAVGLRNQELSQIAEQSRVDLAQAEAERKRTEAANVLRIAQAEAEGRLQKIQAQIEKDHRASELARAETQRQVSKMNSEAESERRLLLAKAELQKQRDLKNLELEKRREIDVLELRKEEDRQLLQHEQQLKLAALCTENPNYASFLVNRELAGQVEIAVLPTGSSPNVFKDLLHHSMEPTLTTDSVDNK